MSKEMSVFVVESLEKVLVKTYIEAETEEEALRKFKAEDEEIIHEEHEVIEGEVTKVYPYQDPYQDEE
jgi:hypothetical protein